MIYNMNDPYSPVWRFLTWPGKEKGYLHPIQERLLQARKGAARGDGWGAGD